MFLLTFALSVLCLASASPANEDRIVNGRGASIHDFPYQASLQLGGSHFCGCSILTFSWLLTAAHCLADPIKDDEVKYLNVRIGTNLWNSGGVTKKVEKAINHPDYDDVTMDCDVGLLKLQTAIGAWSAAIKPVKLFDGVMTSGQCVVVSGWGRMYEDAKDIPQQLQEVSLSSLSRESCAKDFRYRQTDIMDSMVCAVGENKDSCQGDSGGPLNFCRTNCQAGVVSWGAGCAQAGAPGVYCTFAYKKVKDFILQFVKDAEFSKDCNK